MAEAVVGAVVKRLGELIVQEAINLYGEKGKVEWLKGELEAMQCLLKDADAKKNKGDDERVKNWVTKMRDVAFEAEDIIDTFMYYKLRRQQPGCIGFIKRYLFIFVDLIHKHKVYVDVEGIKTKLQDLSQSRSLYGIGSIGETIGTTRSQNVIPILPQLPDDIAMVGFDDEKKKIVQELVDINNTNRSVISIVGMGGLGKTTLAKSVYNDLDVQRSFNIFAWVIISQQYTMLEILKEISLEVSATPSANTIRHLSVAISEKLEKGRYLIVLDDIWEENVLKELLKVFPDVKNGSRVIITTRFKNVAEFADPPRQHHELRLLNEKESKELFLRKAFSRQDIKTCCLTDLVDYVDDLVQMCGGLPLALVVLGGLVFTKKTKTEWEEIVEKMKGQFVEGGKRCLEILKILALSYNDLPSYLKSCFLYFGCFKEDEEIPTKEIIRLWSAEGFLPTKNGTTTEKIGFDCLEELAQRCLIQVTNREYDGSAKYCRIHDLLRNMCISEAKENRFLEIYQNDTADCVTMPNAARRLIIFNDIKTLNYSNSKLRGLFYSHGNIYEHWNFRALNGQLDRFKLLRVLYVKKLIISEFPSEIKSLIHLRYLELHAGRLKEVPSWIGDLHNLQTFIIHGFSDKIPDSLWTIGNLRHVDLSMSQGVDPPNMGNNVPKNLQTLKGLKAGSWIGKTLPKLTNLCELSIHEVSNDHAHALSSSLQKLGRLASLLIAGDENIPSNNIITAFSNQHCLKKLNLDGSLNCKQFPHNDVFPQQLVELHLLDSGLEQDPMATLEKLPCLKYLELRRASYVGKQMICSATGFPQLLFLTISCLDELEEWKLEENAMSCLKSLWIYQCGRLKMIPEGLKNVPLDQLTLGNMSRQFMTRIKKNTGEDWYKIQHVPNITIRIKQKIVIKVQMNRVKLRNKAMKIAAITKGVMVVSIEGKDNDQLVVIGERVDSTTLMSKLRKNVGHAELVSVSEVKKPAELWPGKNDVTSVEDDFLNQAYKDLLIYLLSYSARKNYQLLDLSQQLNKIDHMLQIHSIMCFLIADEDNSYRQEISILQRTTNC